MSIRFLEKMLLLRHKPSFMKISHFSFIGTFIGAIVILNIYLFYHNVNSSSKVEVLKFPKNPGIMKIDIGQGEDDLWILTKENYLYHWDTFKKEFICKNSCTPIVDFAVGSDGTVIMLSLYNIYCVYIRDDIDSWYWVANANQNTRISICNYNLVFITYNNKIFQGYYDYGSHQIIWQQLDSAEYYYDQISCAFHDGSLWFIGRYKHHVYVYIDDNKNIPRSEISFKQIKALSKQHAIGIDYNNDLWEYTKGTWTWIKNNVKGATINNDGEIFFIDITNDNLIYKLSKN
ncbi:hypothetical protein C1645_747054 [Glomus cerebriforme]|uniref:Uncharacterized protein n=1 Tax=Glomus cerebriforme TaxID=658196 RepID=A0A397TNK2_9GLOM|nr:hypothetical protein C1645_747054 [Glomus cerebriforme]